MRYTGIDAVRGAGMDTGMDTGTVSLLGKHLSEALRPRAG